MTDIQPAVWVQDALPGSWPASPPYSIASPSYGGTVASYMTSAGPVYYPPLNWPSPHVPTTEVQRMEILARLALVWERNPEWNLCDMFSLLGSVSGNDDAWVTCLENYFGIVIVQ